MSAIPFEFDRSPLKMYAIKEISRYATQMKWTKKKDQLLYYLFWKGNRRMQLL